MYSYHFKEWLSFFYFYCICGWIFESTYVSLKSRQFTNRGFLRGPWLPIYGSGAITVLWLTLPVQNNPWLVYFAGAIGATILEFFTGEAMVRIFKVRYWDYSDQKLQYKGHICLSSTIAWGFLSLLMVYVIHQPVERLLSGFHEEVLSVMTFLITVLFVYDFTESLHKALDLRAMLIQAENLKKQMEERVEEKKRLMEAVGTLALADAENIVKERKEQLAEAIVERREQLTGAIEERREQLTGAIIERRVQFSDRLKSLEQEMREFERIQEQLKEQMMKNSEQLLLHNPGAKYISKVADSEEILRRIKNFRKKLG